MSDSIMALNANNYIVNVGIAAAAVILPQEDTDKSMVVVYNPTANPLWVQSSKGTAGAPGFAYPTGANPQPSGAHGSLIPAGGKEPYTKLTGDNVINLIQGAGAAGGIASVQVGSGE